MESKKNRNIYNLWRSIILFANKNPDSPAIRSKITLRTSDENSIARHARAAFTLSPAKLLELCPFPFISSIVVSSGITVAPPSELESCPFSREDVLRRKFTPKVLKIRGQSNGTTGIVPNIVGCIVANDFSKTWTIYSVPCNPRFLLPNRAYRRDSHCGGFMSRSKSSWAN